MRFWLLIISVVVSLSSFADGLNPDQAKKIKTSIDKNDSKSVAEVLSAIENPFRCVKNGLGKIFDNTPSHYCTRENDGQELLKQAFKGQPCRDDIAVELLKAGARYDFGSRYSVENLFKDAFENTCLKTVDHLIKNNSDDDVAAAATKFFKYAEHKANSYIETLKSGYEIDKEGIAALKPMNDSFRAFVMAKCPDISKASQACTARETLESAKANMEKNMNQAVAEAEAEDAQEVFANSPEGLKAAICEIDKQIAEAQAEIDRQKKIGKVSGTVDMAVLNRAGSKIVDLQGSRKELKKRLKSKTGKDLAETACRTPL